MTATVQCLLSFAVRLDKGCRIHGTFASFAVLMPLLEYCSVRPDATVSNHRFFGPDAEIRYRVLQM